MLPDANSFSHTQPLTPQFYLKDATGKTAEWITSGWCAHVCACGLTRTSRGAWVGHPSLPRRTTPITQRRSQRQQLDHSCALPLACLFITETNVIATAAMVTLHLPLCLRAERGSESRGEDRQREVVVSVLHCVCLREMYLTSCTLYLNTEDIPNFTWPLLSRGCTGFAS